MLHGNKKFSVSSILLWNLSNPLCFRFLLAKRSRSHDFLKKNWKDRKGHVPSVKSVPLTMQHNQTKASKLWSRTTPTKFPPVLKASEKTTTKKQKQNRLGRHGEKMPTWMFRNTHQQHWTNGKYCVASALKQLCTEPHDARLPRGETVEKFT